MGTPMAVLEMEPVEVSKEATTDPATWNWKPKVKNVIQLADAVRASSQTSRATGTKQTDYGEGK